MTKTLTHFGAALVTALGILSAPAHAAMATLTGTNFDLTYDTSLMDLFGVPTLVGDTLFFTPTNFKAESLNGAGVTATSSTINLRLIPHLGESISTINLLERGDYLLSGALSTVTIAGQIRAFDVTSPTIEVTSYITPTTPLTTIDGVNHNYSATAGVALASSGINQATGVNLTIQNLLRAYTDKNDTGPLDAFIEKKYSGGAVQVVVAAIPEPSSSALLLAGLGFVGAMAVRRRKTQ